MNLPNKLTVLRIVLIPFFLFFLLCDFISNRYIYALGVFILASITDYFDGKIARSSNKVTDFGKFADPLADKCLVISALVCFIQPNLVHPLPVILIILREFTVTSVRFMAVRSGEVISANLWGKAKTVSQIFCIGIIIAIEAFKELVLKYRDMYYIDLYNTFSHTLYNGLVWISVCLSLISGCIYIYLNRKYIES